MAVAPGAASCPSAKALRAAFVAGLLRHTYPTVATLLSVVLFGARLVISASAWCLVGSPIYPTLRHCQWQVNPVPDLSPAQTALRWTTAGAKQHSKDRRQLCAAASHRPAGCQMLYSGLCPSCMRESPGTGRVLRSRRQGRRLRPGKENTRHDLIAIIAAGRSVRSRSCRLDVPTRTSDTTRSHALRTVDGHRGPGTV